MTFQIGNWIAEFVGPFWTTAPDAYDGFGTSTLYRDDNRRLVMMMAQHQEWQTMRYRSGGYQATPEPNAELEDYRDRFIEKLFKGDLDT